MKRLLLFTLFLIAFSGKGRAQETKKDSVERWRKPRNAVYLESFGNAGIASVNYERLIYPKATQTFALRAGMLPMANRENADTSYLHLFVPLEVTVLPRKKNVSPELGVGLAFLNTYTRHKQEANEFRQDVMPVFRFGLRWGFGNSPFLAGRACLF